MHDSVEREAIVCELYSRYQANGFITEDETLACFVTHKISLPQIESITDYLLSIGVIIKVNDNPDDDDEENYDRTRTDYDTIFDEVLGISPGLVVLIDYIRNCKPPQHREWHVLIPQAQNGNTYARDRLFDMYFRVVVKIALKYHKETGYEIDDTIQVGAMGLLQAIKAYDKTKHGSFVSYMPLWIAQYISRAISDLARSIRIPVHMLDTMRTVERTTDELRNASNLEPSIEEIAKACNMTEETVTRILGYSDNTISLNDFLLIDEDGFCSYDIEDSKTPSIEAIVEEDALRLVIFDLLATLKEKEANVIRSRFGLDDGRPKTLEEVGESHGVTRERIRQIEARAIKRLKHPSRCMKFEGYYSK